VAALIHLFIKISLVWQHPKATCAIHTGGFRFLISEQATPLSSSPALRLISSADSQSSAARTPRHPGQRWRQRQDSIIPFIITVTRLLLTKKLKNLVVLRKRPTWCFEKMSSPSATTSKTPLVPLINPSSVPTLRISCPSDWWPAGDNFKVHNR
jgi:hypothetical protein